MYDPVPPSETVRSSGQSIAGSVVSVMVTLKVKIVSFPLLSVIVYSSALIPTGKLAPLPKPPVKVTVSEESSPQLLSTTKSAIVIVP